MIGRLAQVSSPRGLVVPLALTLSLLVPLSPAVATQQTLPDSLPSIQYDDPARLLRPSDFPDIDGLQIGYGASYGPTEWATVGARTPEDGGIDQNELADDLELLDALDWLSQAQMNFGVTPTDDTSQFSSFVESKITRYESARAAEAAFAVLKDEGESQDRDFTDEAAPAVFGSPSEITVPESEHPSGDAFEERNLTFQVDDALVNIFVIGTPEHPEFNEDLLIAGGELVMERMDLDLDELPGLAPLAVQVRTDGVTVDTGRTQYMSIDGDDPRGAVDTEETAASRSEVPRDAIDFYSQIVTILPDASLVTRLYRVESAEAGIDLLEYDEENPFPGFFKDWAVVSNAVELGDAMITVHIERKVDGTVGVGHAVIVQVDDVVAFAALYGSSSFGHEDILFFAEAQVACIDADDCAAVSVPYHLLP